MDVWSACGVSMYVRSAWRYALVLFVDGGGFFPFLNHVPWIAPWGGRCALFGEQRLVFLLYFCGLVGLLLSIWDV